MLRRPIPERVGGRHKHERAPQAVDDRGNRGEQIDDGVETGGEAPQDAAGTAPLPSNLTGKITASIDQIKVG